MRPPRPFTVLLLSTAAFVAVVLQIPQWVHMADSRYRGVPVHLNSDEYVYLSRVQEALSGRGEQAAEAFVGEARLRGSQTALLERAVGTAFRPTGWKAADALQAMDAFVGFFLVLLLFIFLRQCGFGRWAAYGGALAFVIIELYNLNRPIHQGLSFLLILAAFSGIAAGLNGRRWLGFLGAALLGMLMGVVFWTWTFAWLWAGILFLWEGMYWLRMRDNASRDRLRWLLLFGVIAVAAAAPFAWEMLSLARDPLFEEAKFRSGMRPGRLPESWAYSALFLIMAGAVFWALLRHFPRMRRYQLACVTVLTAGVAIHQQLIHGITFNFVSHYIFGMALAAISVILLAIDTRIRIVMAAGAAACIYLAALAWDGRTAAWQFIPLADRYGEQHLASVLPVLDGLPRGRILSDPMTQMFISGSTRHDVVYAIYLKNVLMSHREIAERYCATQLPVPPSARRISEQDWLIYPDANGAFRSPDIRQQEVDLVEQACATADQDPAAVLRRFGVDYIFWNRLRHPEWDLSRIPVPLTTVAEAPEWVLLRLAPAGTLPK